MLLRSHAADAGHRHDRLLDRPRDDERHRLRRQRAGVRDDRRCAGTAAADRCCSAARSAARTPPATSAAATRPRRASASRRRRDVHFSPLSAAPAAASRRVDRSICSRRRAGRPGRRRSPARRPYARHDLDAVTVGEPDRAPAPLRLATHRRRRPRSPRPRARCAGGGHQHDVAVLLGVDVDLHGRADARGGPAGRRPSRTGSRRSGLDRSAGADMTLQRRAIRRACRPVARAAPRRRRRRAAASAERQRTPRLRAAADR